MYPQRHSIEKNKYLIFALYFIVFLFLIYALSPRSYLFNWYYSQIGKINNSLNSFFLLPHLSQSPSNIKQEKFNQIKIDPEKDKIIKNKYDQVASYLLKLAQEQTKDTYPQKMYSFLNQYFTLEEINNWIQNPQLGFILQKNRQYLNLILAKGVMKKNKWNASSYPNILGDLYLFYNLDLLKKEWTLYGEKFTYLSQLLLENIIEANVIIDNSNYVYADESNIDNILNLDNENIFIFFLSRFFYFFLIYIFLIYFIRYSEIYQNKKSIHIFLSIHLIAFLFLTLLLFFSFQFPFLNFSLYIANFFLILLRLFFSFPAALLGGAILLSYLFLLPIFSPFYFLLNVFSYIILICLHRNELHSRLSVLKLSLYMGGIQWALFIIFAWFFEIPSNVFWLGFNYGLNAFLCGLLAFILIPILEIILNKSTVFRFIEYSRLDTDLLKNLMFKAKGTYVHSLNVGHMAQLAAQSIGAKSYLALLGGYYHDIGKMEQAEYFIENNPKSSKHNLLKPSISAVIIKSHVKLGKEKAIKARLPEEVIDIIDQHHGTDVIQYFYHKAIQLEGIEHVNKKNFSYTGRNPQTKEAAIVMLADSVEAAFNMNKTNAVRKLSHLIDDICWKKYRSGLLSQVNLTFRELSQIKSVFLAFLLAKTYKRKIGQNDELKK